MAQGYWPRYQSHEIKDLLTISSATRELDSSPAEQNPDRESTRGGVIVAGVPIGTILFMTSYCLGKVDAIITTMKQVERIVKEPSFESSCQLQTTFYLARVSFQQQLGYWLRCTPPNQTLPAATLLDTRMVEFILTK
jgi:hypothetical protein